MSETRTVRGVANGAASRTSETGRGKALNGFEKPSSGVRRNLFIALRLFLGAVFLLASYDKILHPQAFAQAVYNYQILPDGAVNLTALVLPWLELIIGICLVTGFWMPGAALIGSSLLAIFTGALVFNQLRGLDIHCGCFSTDASQGPAGLWTVARDLLFLSASVYLAVLELLPHSPAKAASDANQENAQ